MMRNLVSVIVPTYNTNLSLVSALESILKQDYSPIEIIVVDDNNPDTKGRKICEKIMLNYKDLTNVIYIRHKKNMNGAVARNTGFKHSKGEFISFLDDDDIYLDKKVRLQVEFLQLNKDYEGVYSWKIYKNRVMNYSGMGNLTKDLLKMDFVPFTSSIMITKKAYKMIGGFNTKYQRHQDYEFLLRFFKYYKIGVVEEPLVKIIGNNVDNTLKLKKLEILKKNFLEEFKAEIDMIEKEEKGFRKTIFSRHYSVVFWNYIKNKHYFSAFKTYFKLTIKCGYRFNIALIRYYKKYISEKRRESDNEK